MKAKQFAVGDAVTWTSSAAGSTTTKTGVVVDVLPAGFMPRREHMKIGLGGYRNHVSYVVEVTPPNKERARARTLVKPRKSVFYWPIANKLRASKAGAS